MTLRDRCRSIYLLSLTVSCGCFATADPLAAVAVDVSNHTMIVDLQGKMYASGYNANGQLGIGDKYARSFSCPVGDSAGWSRVWTGPEISIAKKTDGSMWACGFSFYVHIGMGLTGRSSSFVPIGSEKDWEEISIGSNHLLASKSDGSLWSCGSDSSGVLGLGATGGGIRSLTRIGAGNDWRKIASGDQHNLALKADGSLWVWGGNTNGRLGDGTTVMKTSPVQIGSYQTWKGVAAGQSHSLAIGSNGSLWAWGSNSSGQLGIGSVGGQIITPMRVGIDNNWLLVAAGANHSIALKADGSLWTWGGNSFGQLGHGDTVIRNVPTRMGTAKNWKSIDGGGFRSAAIRSDDSIWTWGRVFDQADGSWDASPDLENFPMIPDISVSMDSYPLGSLSPSGSTLSPDFPTTVEGVPTEKKFHVYNHGSAPLSITGIATASGFTSSLATPLVVLPGAYGELPVSVDGTVTGALAGDLIISSNDPDEASFTLHLAGQVLSHKSDTDQDGMNDASEWKMRELGFRWDQPNVQLVNLLADEAHQAGLVTESQLRTRYPGHTLVKRGSAPGKIPITVRMETSPDLRAFLGKDMTGARIDSGGRLLVPLPALPGNKFVRFSLTPSTP